MIKDKKRHGEPVEAVENVDDAVIEPVHEEVKKPAVVKKSVSVEDFIARKLKVINEWPDGAKKRNAAERLLRNKEV